MTGKIVRSESTDHLNPTKTPSAISIMSLQVTSHLYQTFYLQLLIVECLASLFYLGSTTLSTIKLLRLRAIHHLAVAQTMYRIPHVTARRKIYHLPVKSRLPILF